MKRNELIRRIRRAARTTGVKIEVYELSRHSGIRVDNVATTIPRHAEIPDRLAEAIFKQLEPVLGKG
jgi:mRNA interferase HicA